MGLMARGEGEVKDWTQRHWLGPGLRRLGTLVLDQLYPPVCAGCRAPLEHSDALCGACFAQLRPITEPLCPVLGLPFDSDQGDGALSAEAIADPPPFDRARAALSYGEMVGTLVSQLKYGDRPELARLCARLMAGAGRDLLANDALLVPVPLHPQRLRFRRYNQSFLLAQELARMTGLRIDPHLVQRHRQTRQQVGLSGDARTRNVQGAFVAHRDLLRRLGGRPIVIIDDVYTTGATVKAVTRALKRGGAERIDVLSFARVVIGADLPI
jgi:ComF family protein